MGMGISLYQLSVMKKAKEGFYVPILEEISEEFTSAGVGCQGWGPTAPLSRIGSSEDVAVIR